MNSRLSRAARWIGAFALIVPGAYAMHLHLVKSTPREGDVLTAVPTAVRLWFSQKPEVSLTTIRLLREDSSVVNLGKVARTDDSLSVAAPVTAGLMPGGYIVTWRTLSKDGHAVRGSYQFTVAAGPPAGGQTGGN